MRGLIVNVTQADINLGLKGDCDRCPIALALQRTLWNLLGFQIPVYVGPALTEFDIGDDTFWAKTPIVARQFISAFDFDSTWPTKPFSLTLMFEKFPQHLVA